MNGEFYCPMTAVTVASDFLEIYPTTIKGDSMNIKNPSFWPNGHRWLRIPFNWPIARTRLRAFDRVESRKGHRLLRHHCFVWSGASNLWRRLVHGMRGAKVKGCMRSQCGRAHSSAYGRRCVYGSLPFSRRCGNPRARSVMFGINKYLFFVFFFNKKLGCLWHFLKGI